MLQLFDEACARDPAATALISGAPRKERTLTFGELGERSRRLAARFRAAGLQAGDAVAIFIPPSAALYAVMAAVLRLGLIAVFVDPTRWRQTLEQAAARLRLRAFVGTPAACALRWFVPALRRIPNAFVTGGMLPGAASLADAAQYAAVATMENCPDDAPALLTFTSGSTGRPKGVLRSHGMLAATHRILAKSLALEPGHVGLTNLPFIVFSNLAAGVGTVIPDLDLRRPAKVDARALARQIREYKVSSFVTTPFVARCVAEFCERRRTTFDDLRHIDIGGAPVFPELLDRLLAAAPQARVGAIYGATEAEPIAAAVLADFGREEREITRKGGGVLVGHPAEGTVVRIIGDAGGIARKACTRADFDRETLTGGRCGEIVVCGQNVSRGYLGGEGDRENKIDVDGDIWHRTGDAGYFDRQGRLWLAGRCAARMVRNQEAFYSLQAEAALAGVRGVDRTAMVQDKDGRIVLVVQPARAPGDVSTDALLSRLAWCAPDEIVFVREMPLDRRHHAKVTYGEVLALLERGAWSARTTLSPAPLHAPVS